MSVPHSLLRPRVGVLLADSRGNWTSLWRRPLASQGIRVHSLETLEAITACLPDRPWDLVAIVLDAFPAEALWAWWQADRERRPAGSVCLLGGRECEALGWALLEAGGVAWVRSPQDIRLAVRVAQRHCSSVSFERLPFVDRLQHTLPWA